MAPEDRGPVFEFLHSRGVEFSISHLALAASDSLLARRLCQGKPGKTLAGLLLRSLFLAYSPVIYQLESK
jgi:hypothetical protein